MGNSLWPLHKLKSDEKNASLSQARLYKSFWSKGKTEENQLFDIYHHHIQIMFFPSLRSIITRLTTRWPLLLSAATWTILLTMTVAVASLAPELAFVSLISPSSSFSRPCYSDGFVRIPLDFPRQSLCVPSRMAKRSPLDFFVPTLFSALVVAASTFVVRSLCLWEIRRAWSLTLIFQLLFLFVVSN